MRAKLDVNGSLEYELTWKHWDTESDAPICALRASARRTFVNVSIGWPIEGRPKTPMASDGDGGVMEIRPGADGKYKLRDFAQLAGWATATATATKTTQSGDLQNFDGTPWDGTSKPYQNGQPVTTALGDQVKLVGWNTAMANDAIRRGSVAPSEKTLNNAAALTGWATAKATDGDKSSRTPQGAARELATRNSIDLPTMAVILAGWPTARTVTGGAESAERKQELGRTESGGGDLQAVALGVILELFRVPTGRRVVLAPEFSLWLMGFPEAWAKAAPNSDAWRAAQAALESEYLKDLETQSFPS